MEEEADYTNWRVMVDDSGQVLRSEEEGGYCIWNVEDQSVVVLPPDDESTNLIAHLLLRPVEETIQSVLHIDVQQQSEDETPTIKNEIKEEPTDFWLTETPNVEGCSDCAELLIMVVGTYLIQNLLSDTRSNKKRVWQTVARRIIDCGYKVPGRTIAKQGESVFQKWRELEMAYLKFQKNKDRCKKELPPYYDALNKVLGKKETVHSHFLLDSDSSDNSNKKSTDSSEYIVESADVVETTERSMSPSFVCEIIQDLAAYESILTPRPKPSKDDIINFWSTETPDIEGCKNCTELMINFVGDDLIQELINEKTISQKKVWQYIAKIMSDNGYRVPGQNLEEQGEKVYQKWKNMGRMYAKFKELTSLSTTAYRDPPSYFDALDKVVQKLQQTDNTKLILSSFSAQNPSPDVSMDVDIPYSPGQDLHGGETSVVQNKPTKEDIVNYWATETPDVENCRNCTELMIMFVGEDSIQDMFNDKKASQKKVWQYIASIMEEHGYKVPGQTLEEQGEKIYQKWKNMGRMYAKYKDHVYEAEPAYKDPPPCFDALDKVVRRLQECGKQKLLLSSFVNSKKPVNTTADHLTDFENIQSANNEPSTIEKSQNTPLKHYKPSKDEIISYWMTETPDREGCNNCTELLIEVVSDETIQKLLKNKKTSKKKVWQIVAQRLNGFGYQVPGATLEDQGEKVYQKWKNMGNSYTKFKTHLIQSGGNPQKEPPSFFDALDKVLGKNDVFRPRLLYDSFSESRLRQIYASSPDSMIGTDQFSLSSLHNLPKPPGIVFVNEGSIRECMKDEPTSYWYTETPNIENCRNTAELLILIVGEESVQKMLRDKIFPRKKVWQVVAKMLQNYGYKVPGMTIGIQGERVHQKWRNMEKVYFKYRMYMNQTGEVYKDPPSYFNLMDQVMKIKHAYSEMAKNPFRRRNLQRLNNERLTNEPSSFWLTETPDITGCKNCTELLIKLVGSMQKILNNKIGPQKRVWHMIAKKMCLHGYKVPGNDVIEQGDKVRDKWKSMEKVYRKYKRHLSYSGQARKFFPPYFDAMDKVLGKKHVFHSTHKPIRKMSNGQDHKDGSDIDSESSNVSTGATSDNGPNNQSFWLTETPNLEGIKNVTELLIMIVGDKAIRKMLYSKKNAKKKVWQIVVNKMRAFGYIVPGLTMTERAEKVRMKWKNMEKVYLKYKDHVSHKGHARKFFPYYYDAMYKVLGLKQVIQPKLLRQSFSNESSVDGQVLDSENPDSFNLEETSVGNETEETQQEDQNFWWDETVDAEGVNNRTELLVKIVGKNKIQKILRNRKNPNEKIWQLVALNMAHHGHIIPAMTLPEKGEIVRLKWESMEKTFIKHKQHIHKTGEPHKDLPDYYNAMDEVIGDDHYPKLLLGSVHSLRTPQEDSIWNNSDEISTQLKQEACDDDSIETVEDDNVASEFSSVSSLSPIRTKYFSDQDDNSLFSKPREQYYINELKTIIVEECTKEREVQQKNHEEITKLLLRQNQQREDMLSLLKQLIDHSKSTESESDSN